MKLPPFFSVISINLTVDSLPRHLHDVTHPPTVLEDLWILMYKHMIIKS